MQTVTKNPQPLYPNNKRTLRRKKEGSKTAPGKENLLTHQKREKIKSLMVDKLTKQYGTSNEDIIRLEVNKFFTRDKVNAKDLKQMEEELQKKLQSRFEQDTLKKNLLSNQKEEVNECKNNSSYTSVKLPAINPNYPNQSANVDNTDNLSAKSGMSGGSDLYKFNERNLGDEEMEQEMKDFQKMNLNKKNEKKNVPQIDYSKYNDEWDAINMYNKKLFLEEKRINKIKDKEVQRRTKADLDFQVKAKLVREYQEKLKDREYDEIVDKHLIEMDKLEKQKEMEVKKRLLKEKESRDKQLKDKYIAKRIEKLKNKKFERELVKNVKEEIERDKRMAIEKKLAEKEALQKTMKDNEIHKQILAEEIKKEKELDIKMMEDDIKIKNKQEQDRIDYFKRIERNANSFMDSAIEGVLSKQKEKMADEERRMNEYIEFENRMADLEEEKKRLKKLEDQRKLREVLDKQIEKRKLDKEYEKKVDKMQGEIWDKDTAMYYENEKRVKAIIREMNLQNLKALKNQLNENAKRGEVDAGMSDYEKGMNKELLEKANAMA
ncbi:MAG: hypothetical protein MJ252_18775 [archaeon]|nr:hypothetical protein [archaeon]